MQPIDQVVGKLKTYWPLILIFLYLTVAALVANSTATGVSWYGWMKDFMAGFFLVFSAFKFLDLKGFAKAYASYDILAARWQPYGIIYPFLELGLGLWYLSGLAPMMAAAITVLLMGFSSIGVLQVLLKKRQIRCACLGTVINVPMSSITLIEDLTMVLMAVGMLLNLA